MIRILLFKMMFGLVRMYLSILKGVTMGRGSVIAVGAVVNKSTLLYSINAGVPAKKIKFRFTLEEILEHERILYSESKRLKYDELEKMFNGNK